MNEYDRNCRTYGGLLKEMKRIYKGFSANENVTIIDFKTGEMNERNINLG